MNFTDIFVRRPVLSICLSIVLLGVGLIAFRQLNIREYPKIAAGSITITTSYPGADAKLVESFITTPIENAIAGVSGVNTIKSVSSPGVSSVSVHLKLNANINAALNDITSDVSSVSKRLPQGVDSPTIQKRGSESSMDVMIAFSSKTATPAKISDYLTRVIVPEFSNLNGVSSVHIMGQRNYAMRIWLNPAKMAALSINSTDIQNALHNNNFQSTAGQIDRQWQSLIVQANTTLETPEAFSRIVIKKNQHQVVHLGDVAQVTLGVQNKDDSIYVNGKRTVAIGMTTKADGNLLNMTHTVKHELQKIKPTMPDGIHAQVIYDTSTFVKSAIHKVNESIIEASIFVILIIFLFIASLRSALIPVVTIPLAMISAFGLMLVLGYSINTMTLLAFVLGIGLVVDDAIIVLENVHRHIESGLSPLQAAFKGAREIRFAIIVMSFTLFAVYAPIGFIHGLTGSLFKEFAFTLAGTVLISGVIALTLSPMMCSKIMRPIRIEGKFEHLVNAIFTKTTDLYRAGLTYVIQYSRVAVLLAILFILGTGVLLMIPLSKTAQLLPTEDRGALIAISQGPSSANLAYTEKYAKKVAHILNAVPEKLYLGNVNGLMGTNTALFFLTLTDWAHRHRSSEQILHALDPQIQALAGGFNTTLLSPSGVPGSHGFYPLEFIIKTTGSYQALNTTIQKILAELRKNPHFMMSDTDLKIDSPQVQVDINRNLALDLGISMRDIGNALSIALGQPKSSNFTIHGRTYYVIPQLVAKARMQPQQLDNIYVKTAAGKAVPLSMLIHIKNIVTSISLNHFQGQRAAKITAILAPGYSITQAISTLKNIAHHILPSDMSYDFAGDARTALESHGSMVMLFMYALFFVYLLLSAQFESFSDPLIILFSVPLALVGALLALIFSGSTLNIYTEIGLITLIGLISKHGILIVSFANELREQGLSKREAIIQGSSIRLRPILMTTLAMVIGAVPMVLTSGAGAEPINQIGWVIIGGMTFGTIFTLFIVPTLYTFLSRHRIKNTLDTIKQDQPPS